MDDSTALAQPINQPENELQTLFINYPSLDEQVFSLLNPGVNEG
jgi:hypothetical protein